MLFNIRTGYGAVPQQENQDIVILVSSLHQAQEKGVPFVFTDRHAYLRTARFFSDLGHLEQVDWVLLQTRDFKRDPQDPGKTERYQAEALVHRHMPAEALLGVCCYNQKVRDAAVRAAELCGLPLKIFVRPGWYFP
jgi:hypothetical protein